MAQLPLMLAAALVMTQAACVPEPTPPGSTGDPPVPAGKCNAANMQGLVGKPASVLDVRKFAPTVRIVRPGMAVTMDFNPDRATIEVDEKEMIVRVSCG